MSRLRVLIVDDEDLARLRMRSLPADGDAPAVEVAGEAGGAADALHWLAANQADLVLLDINMPLRTPGHAEVLDDALADLEQRLGDTMLRIPRDALVAPTAVTRLERRAPPEGEADAGGCAVQVGATREWLAEDGVRPCEARCS